jgi:hypothetical protein
VDPRHLATLVRIDSGQPCQRSGVELIIFSATKPDVTVPLSGETWAKLYLKSGDLKVNGDPAEAARLIILSEPVFARESCGRPASRLGSRVIEDNWVRPSNENILGEK